MLEQAMDRLLGLDETIDGPALLGAYVAALSAGPAHRLAAGADLLAGHTDPAVGILRDELVDVIVGPRLLTAAGSPSPAAQRRAPRAARCFDEGYLVGRIALDTHRVALRWSSARSTVRPEALRSLVLHPRLARTYAGSRRLAPFVRDLTDQTRGLPADQAAQFAGLGLLTAVTEWTVVVGDPARRDVVLAAC